MPENSCAKNPPEVASVDECKVYEKLLYKHRCRERTAVLKMEEMHKIILIGEDKNNLFRPWVGSNHQPFG